MSKIHLNSFSNFFFFKYKTVLQSQRQDYFFELSAMNKLKVMMSDANHLKKIYNDIDHYFDSNCEL